MALTPTDAALDQFAALSDEDAESVFSQMSDEEAAHVTASIPGWKDRKKIAANSMSGDAAVSSSNSADLSSQPFQNTLATPEQMVSRPLTPAEMASAPMTGQPAKFEPQGVIASPQDLEPHRVGSPGQLWPDLKAMPLRGDPEFVASDVLMNSVRAVEAVERNIIDPVVMPAIRDFAGTKLAVEGVHAAMKSPMEVTHAAFKKASEVLAERAPYLSEKAAIVAGATAEQASRDADMNKFLSRELTRVFSGRASANLTQKEVDAGITALELNFGVTGGAAVQAFAHGFADLPVMLVSAPEKLSLATLEAVRGLKLSEALATRAPQLAKLFESAVPHFAKLAQGAVSGAIQGGAGALADVEQGFGEGVAGGAVLGGALHAGIEPAAKVAGVIKDKVKAVWGKLTTKAVATATDEGAATLTKELASIYEDATNLIVPNGAEARKTDVSDAAAWAKDAKGQVYRSEVDGLHVVQLAEPPTVPFVGEFVQVGEKSVMRVYALNPMDRTLRVHDMPLSTSAQRQAAAKYSAETKIQVTGGMVSGEVVIPRGAAKDFALKAKPVPEGTSSDPYRDETVGDWWGNPDVKGSTEPGVPVQVGSSNATKPIRAPELSGTHEATVSEVRQLTATEASTPAWAEGTKKTVAPAPPKLVVVTSDAAGNLRSTAVHEPVAAHPNKPLAAGDDVLFAPVAGGSKTKRAVIVSKYDGADGFWVIKEAGQKPKRVRASDIAHRPLEAPIPEELRVAVKPAEKVEEVAPRPKLVRDPTPLDNSAVHEVDPELQARRSELLDDSEAHLKEAAAAEAAKPPEVDAPLKAGGPLKVKLPDEEMMEGIRAVMHGHGSPIDARKLALMTKDLSVAEAQAALEHMVDVGAAQRTGRGKFELTFGDDLFDDVYGMSLIPGLNPKMTPRKAPTAGTTNTVVEGKKKRMLKMFEDFNEGEAGHLDQGPKKESIPGYLIATSEDGLRGTFVHANGAKTSEIMLDKFHYSEPPVKERRPLLPPKPARPPDAFLQAMHWSPAMTARMNTAHKLARVLDGMDRSLAMKTAKKLLAPHHYSEMEIAAKMLQMHAAKSFASREKIALDIYGPYRKGKVGVDTKFDLDLAKVQAGRPGFDSAYMSKTHGAVWDKFVRDVAEPLIERARANSKWLADNGYVSHELEVLRSRGEADQYATSVYRAYNLPAGEHMKTVAPERIDKLIKYLRDEAVGQGKTPLEEDLGRQAAEILHADDPKKMWKSITSAERIPEEVAQALQREEGFALRMIETLTRQEALIARMQVAKSIADMRVVDATGRSINPNWSRASRPDLPFAVPNNPAWYGELAGGYATAELGEVLKAMPHVQSEANKLVRKFITLRKSMLTVYNPAAWVTSTMGNFMSMGYVGTLNLGEPVKTVSSFVEAARQMSAYNSAPGNTSAASDAVMKLKKYGMYDHAGYEVEEHAARQSVLKMIQELHPERTSVIDLLTAPWDAMVAGPHKAFAHKFGVLDTVTKVASFIQLEQRFLAEGLKAGLSREKAAYAGEIRAVHMINKYFPNNANPNKVAKLMQDIPFIGGDFARTGTEVTRNFANAAYAAATGKDGMRMRALKTTMFIGALKVGMNAYAEHVNGVTQQERDAVFASLPEYLANQPGLVAWPGARPPMTAGMTKPSDAGFYVIDLTNGFDPLRLLQGNPDDFAPLRVATNLLKTAFNQDRVNQVVQQPLASLGLMSPPTDFHRDPNSMEEPASQLFTQLQGAGLIPGAVRGIQTAMKASDPARAESNPFAQPMGPGASLLKGLGLSIRAVGPRTQLAALREQVFKLKENKKEVAALLMSQDGLQAMQKAEETGDPAFLVNILKRFGDATDKRTRRITDVGTAMEATK